MPNYNKRYKANWEKFRSFAPDTIEKYRNKILYSDTFRYLVDEASGKKYRQGVVDDSIVIDKELTITGFDGVRNVDWERVPEWGIVGGEEATEEGTFVIDVSFYDTEDNLVAPDTMQWSLKDNNGNVINNRENVTIDSPSSEETVVLSGDDLVMNNTKSHLEVRFIVFDGTYTSTIGNGLPLRRKFKFYVVSL